MRDLALFLMVSLGIAVTWRQPDHALRQRGQFLPRGVGAGWGGVRRIPSDRSTWRRFISSKIAAAPGAGRTGQGDQAGLGRAIEDARPGGVGRALTGQCHLKAFLDQALARPADGRGAGIQGLDDPRVIPPLTGPGNIGLENLTGRMLALVGQDVQPLTLLRAQSDDMPLETGFGHGLASWRLSNDSARRL